MSDAWERARNAWKHWTRDDIEQEVSPMRSVRSKGLFTCPFCTGQFSITTDDNGGLSGVAHSLPSCATFDVSDPVTFVRVARESGARVVS